MAEKFTQEKFIANIAYLADIFNSLNSLNQSMQGTGFTVIDHAAKITTYYKKLILWQTYVNRDEFGMFPELKKYIAGKKLKVKDTTIEHLYKLSKKMEHYYGDVLASTSKHHWIIDPFAVTNLPELPLRVAEEFTEIRLNLRTKFLSIRLKKNTQKYRRIFSFGFFIRLCQYI